MCLLEFEIGMGNKKYLCLHALFLVSWVLCCNDVSMIQTQLTQALKIY